MKPWLFVGAKVVCTKRDAWAGDRVDQPERDPQYGEVLTVREITADDGAGFTCLRFVEISNPKVRWCAVSRKWNEARYWAVHFRPITTIDTTHQVTEMVELMKRARKTQRVDA